MRKKKTTTKRNNQRIKLPNCCECSQLTVTPRNWDTPDGDTGRPWLISYRFYSPTGSKQVQIRGMNTEKDLTLRQRLTRKLIQEELIDLQEGGYNPIDDVYRPAATSGSDYVIHPQAPFSEALNEAFKHYTGVPASRTDLKSSLKYLQLSIHALNYQDRPVCDIKRRHILNVLENCENIKQGFNNRQFNHYRTALLSLYKILKRYDTVEYSPAEDIEMRQHTPKRRKELTMEQRIELDRRLRRENPRLWNFMHLFYHSGARLSEMARVQGEHVNLKEQWVDYYVKKRKVWTWVRRPIVDAAVEFWGRALAGCAPKQYVFAKNLQPGDRAINSKQYTRRWYNWVKHPLENKPAKWGQKRERIDWMDVDFYALKYVHTTDVIDALGKGIEEGEKEAAKINGHTSTKMVRTRYDLRNKERRDEKIKRLPLKLA